ncbi:Uncharacterized protein TCM_020829 [Theobroma cacao]|uniref:Uncharacterized protein n=1 Tax=Theobroma cacao TaxID=3641 RepID=A0A061ELN9_THECC|nr:Uncharacterized protein TCM_020829 [Theobroma cacao]
MLALLSPVLKKQDENLSCSLLQWLVPSYSLNSHFLCHFSYHYVQLVTHFVFPFPHCHCLFYYALKFHCVPSWKIISVGGSFLLSYHEEYMCSILL